MVLPHRWQGSIRPICIHHGGTGDHVSLSVCVSDCPSVCLFVISINFFSNSGVVTYLFIQGVPFATKINGRTSVE